jgi:hypothetical protein
LASSSLAEQGWSRLLMTGFLRDTLIRHFQSGQIWLKELAEKTWCDGDSSRILIESNTQWRPDVLGQRPAIIIKPNSCALHPIVIGDLSGGGTNGEGRYDYTVIWVGSHTLFCLHGTGASTEVLAAEVKLFLTAYSPIFRECLNLLKATVVEMGEIVRLAEARDHFAVSVTFAWAFQFSWSLTPEALPLRQAEVHLDL